MCIPTKEIYIELPRRAFLCLLGRSIALNIIRKNLDLEAIAEITGLTIAQPT